MKKAFTLIELLIVVTIMATLMTIVFRLGTVSDDQNKKITTITRLQKLENCLSGYFSAFGSYPPVAIYGSRNIYAEVENGVQTDNVNGQLNWEQIEAACRSQPLEACFPFSEDEADTVSDYSDHYQELASDWSDSARRRYGSGFVSDFSLNVNRSGLWDQKDWKTVQIFKFGVMSYLLPRYLVMMSGPKLFYGAEGNNPCKQWDANNDKCVNALDGTQMSWNDVYEAVSRDDNTTVNDGIRNMSDYIKVANIPTQSVCARWIGNLAGICSMGSVNPNKTRFFGVNIKNSSWDMWSVDEGSGPRNLQIYSPGNSGSGWYVLNTITVHDGWSNPFYYYAPNGAQSYTLWSAGPNYRTFPPWVDIKTLLDKTPTDPDGDSNMTIAEAIADDIVRMRH